MSKIWAIFQIFQISDMQHHLWQLSSSKKRKPNVLILNISNSSSKFQKNKGNICSPSEGWENTGLELAYEYYVKKKKKKSLPIRFAGILKSHCLCISNILGSMVLDEISFFFFFGGEGVGQEE